MQILKELGKLRPEFLTSRMIRSKGKWWWSWLPMEPMSVTPRSLLWISGTSVEPAPQYQRLQEQSVAVPLWSALCPRVSLQEQRLLLLIHLLDPISTPLSWQNLSDERDLGHAAPGFSLGIQSRGGRCDSARSTTACLPHSALQFNSVKRFT